MPISTDLRARLQQLSREHSQADLARQTGVTPSNISRYLAGMKVPAEFCIALVNKLGVNPAWLLTGEGAVYLADVDASQGLAAREMLELVRAMDAVARVKLGALSGKPDRRLLRDLSDTIEAFEKLRTQLHMKTAGFLRQLLDQLHAAIEAHDLPKAGFLCQAARQASRFCDDPELARRMDHYEAHLLSVQRKDESALKLQARAISRYLALAEPDLMVMHEINAHAVYLLRVGRIEDARRTSRAACEMALDLEHLPDYQIMRQTQGIALAMLGKVREGASIVFDTSNRLGPAELEYYASELATIELFMGLSDCASKLAQHRQWARDGRMAAASASVGALLTFVFFEGNADLIREAMQFYAGDQALGERVPRFLQEYSGVAVQALETGAKAASAVKGFLKSRAHQARINAESPVDRFRGHATACELLLLSRQSAAARTEWQATEELAGRLGKRYQIPILQQALHQKNALRLFEGKQAAAAQEFFAHYHKEGYACFRPWVGVEK